MSLVDKLNDVHIGDLISLDYKTNISVVGYLAAYAHNKVKLSNMNTRDKNGEIRGTSFFKKYDKEKIVTLNLDEFFSYEVLKKYEAPKKEVTKD